MRRLFYIVYQSPAKLLKSMDRDCFFLIALWVSFLGHCTLVKFGLCNDLDLVLNAPGKGEGTAESSTFSSLTAMLAYVHGNNHCQLLNHTVPGQASPDTVYK